MGRWSRRDQCSLVVILISELESPRLTAGIIGPETTVGPRVPEVDLGCMGFRALIERAPRGPRRSAGYQKPKRAILLCLSARHKRNKRHRTRKRKSHREIKRAPRGKRLGRRVRNGVDFGARWFFGHVASSEARVGVR